MKNFALICSMCLSCNLLVAGTDNNCPLDALLESLEAHQTDTNWLAGQTAICRLDSLVQPDEPFSVCDKFDKLQIDTRRAAVLLLSLSKELSDNDYEPALIFDLADVYFTTLQGIKSRIQQEFDAFEWYDRLANMLPFIQSRTALSHGQTTLLAIVSQTLSRAHRPAARDRGWVLAGRMLDEMEFKIAGYGASRAVFIRASSSTNSRR